MEVQIQDSLASLWSAWHTSTALFGFLGLGPTELGIVCVVAVVLFGHRLPDAMRAMGSAMRGFREEVRQSVPEVKEVA
jgi:TatA/E family protein of Tat protein translocase